MKLLKLLTMATVFMVMAFGMSMADDGRVTFFASGSFTSRTGKDFSLTKNTSGTFEFGAMYYMDGNHSIAVRAGLREIPVYGEGLSGEERKSIQIGFSKAYKLGFTQGFMKEMSFVALFQGNDVLNSESDFDLVAGFGIMKRLNIQDGAAVLALMPFLTMTDIDGSNLIQVGLQVNITPPAQ